MSKNLINLQNTCYALIIVSLSVYILIAAKIVIAPLVFSVFLSLMLMPIANFIEKKIKRGGLSIIITYLVVVIPLSLAILFFSAQSITLFRELPSAEDRLRRTVDNVFAWLNRQFDLDLAEPSEYISDNITAILDVPLTFLVESIESTTIVLANIVLVVIVTYFLLLYRSAFKNFFMVQFSPGESREKVDALFNRIQDITQHYLFGLGLVILILGFLIGLGLWLIGVPFAFFWGFLAALLGIVPYIGTTIGGILPFLYVLAISSNYWQPLAVVGLYFLVQQIEGNFITPNIMGSSIKINPLFAIFGLFVGGVIWGIAGMILALPTMAVLKEVMRSFDSLAPLSYLMENNLSRNANLFFDKFDDPKYRILRLFVQKREKQE